MACTGYILRSVDPQSEAIAQVVYRMSTEPICLRKLPSQPRFDGCADVKDMLDLIPKIDYRMLNMPGSLQRSVRSIATSYLAYLPSRSGHNAALDAASRCSAMAVRRLWMQFAVGDQSRELKTDIVHLDRNDPQILGSYAAALHALQQALKEDTDSISSETTCAAALLCYFEVRKEFPAPFSSFFIFEVLLTFSVRKL